MFLGKRTLYTILVGGLDFGQDYFSSERPKDSQPEDNYDRCVALEVVDCMFRTDLYTRGNRPHT